MLPSAPLFIFIVFNIFSGIYNTYTLCAIMDNAPTTNKRPRLWWQFTRHIINANQLIFGTSIIIHALTHYGLLPPIIDTLTSYCFILSGTINFFAVFYLTPFYIFHASLFTRKQAHLVSLSIIFSSIYFIYYIQFMTSLLKDLEKTELYQFFNPLSSYISLPMTTVCVFSLMINIYSFCIAFDLQQKSTGLKKFFIRCLCIPAGFGIFIHCYFIFETILSLIPNSFIASAYFHDFDTGEALFRLFLLIIIVAINLFSISVLTPFYARTKLYKPETIKKTI